MFYLDSERRREGHLLERRTVVVLKRDRYTTRALVREIIPRSESAGNADPRTISSRLLISVLPYSPNDQAEAHFLRPDLLEVDVVLLVHEYPHIPRWCDADFVSFQLLSCSAVHLGSKASCFIQLVVVISL